MQDTLQTGLLPPSTPAECLVDLPMFGDITAHTNPLVE